VRIRTLRRIAAEALPPRRPCSADLTVSQGAIDGRHAHSQQLLTGVSAWTGVAVTIHRIDFIRP